MQSEGRGKPSECSSTADLVLRSRNSPAQERSPQLNCQADMLLPHCEVWADHLQAARIPSKPSSPTWHRLTEHSELEGAIPVPRLGWDRRGHTQEVPHPLLRRATSSKDTPRSTLGPFPPTHLSSRLHIVLLPGPPRFPSRALLQSPHYYQRN